MSTKCLAAILVLSPLLASCVNPMYSAAERAETAEYLRKVKDPATYYAMDCETFLATKQGWEKHPSMAGDPVNLVIQQVARQRDCSVGSAAAPAAAAVSPGASTAMPASVPNQSGALGLHITSVTPSVAQQFGLATVSGVLVVRPVPGSGAEKAGMLTGDIVLQIAGTPVNSPAELTAVASRIRPGFAAPLKVWRNRAPIDALVEIGESSGLAPSVALVPPAAAAPKLPLAAPVTSPASNSAANTSFCFALFEARQVQGLSDYPSRGLITAVWQGPALSGTPARLAMPEFQAFTRAQGYDVKMQPMFCQPIGASEQCQALGSESFMLTTRSFTTMVNCTETLQGVETTRGLLLKQWPYLQTTAWRPLASQ
ncbi:S1C family serine protease [Pseudomonas thivervalensis]|uniref:S1C family serine protease n=1 Tax=Pseudomonas thivervalensis TaxID=86265 RepID=UPI000879ECCE|nr:PDZ domain-containing protein [Pseudomonas thivervalensis]SDG35377.1 PDZ domain-containing protein [Pseudomonas thivervalensis]